MNIFNLRSGKKLDGPVAIVSDLDKMIAEPIAFRLHGKVHQIKPLSVKEFYKYSNALARLNGLRDSSTIERDELLESYYVLFNSVIDTFKHEDVENMTQVQVSALFQLILDAVRGRAYTDDEELKKTLKPEKHLEETLKEIQISASDLTAEAALIFGWTADHILDMPASRFFSVLQSGRKLTERTNAKQYMNLCHVQSISIGNAQQYENILKKFYYESIGRSDIMERANKPLDPTDQFTVNAVSSIFETMTGLQN